MIYFIKYYKWRRAWRQSIRRTRKIKRVMLRTKNHGLRVSLGGALAQEAFLRFQLHLNKPRRADVHRKKNGCAL